MYLPLENGELYLIGLELEDQEASRAVSPYPSLRPMIGKIAAVRFAGARNVFPHMGKQIRKRVLRELAVRAMTEAPPMRHGNKLKILERLSPHSLVPVIDYLSKSESDVFNYVFSRARIAKRDALFKGASIPRKSKEVPHLYVLRTIRAEVRTPFKEHGMIFPRELLMPLVEQGIAFIFLPVALQAQSVRIGLIRIEKLFLFVQKAARVYALTHLDGQRESAI